LKNESYENIIESIDFNSGNSNNTNIKGVLKKVRNYQVVDYIPDKEQSLEEQNELNSEMRKTVRWQDLNETYDSGKTSKLK
jgi:hypothetical protein